MISLFETLIRDGLIHAEVIGGSKKEPWTYAVVSGLSEVGLRQIRELPDQKDALMARLDALEEAISGLSEASEEEKRRGLDAVKEFKHLARSLSAQGVGELLGALSRVFGQ